MVKTVLYVVSETGKLSNRASSQSTQVMKIIWHCKQLGLFSPLSFQIHFMASILELFWHLPQHWVASDGNNSRKHTEYSSQLLRFWVCTRTWRGIGQIQFPYPDDLLTTSCVQATSLCAFMWIPWKLLTRPSELGIPRSFKDFSQLGDCFLCCR